MRRLFGLLVLGVAGLFAAGCASAGHADTGGAQSPAAERAAPGALPEPHSVTGAEAVKHAPLLEVTMKSGAVLTGVLLRSIEGQLIISESQGDHVVDHILPKADIRAVRDLRSGTDVTAVYLR